MADWCTPQCRTTIIANTPPYLSRKRRMRRGGPKIRWLRKFPGDRSTDLWSLMSIGRYVSGAQRERGTVASGLRCTRSILCPLANFLTFTTYSTAPWGKLQAPHPSFARSDFDSNDRIMSNIVHESLNNILRLKNVSTLLAKC